MRTNFLREHLALVIAATLAMCVLVARACLQSITLDEASSFLGFANTSWAAHWYPANDNHVLNSILMRLLTAVFGVNELVIRTPALIGGAIYIGAALWLCVLLSDRKLLQFALFLCLVYNPMVMDYLVAARGYGLAVGFLLAAIAVIGSAILAPNEQSEADLRKKCAWVSCLLALSFAGNFSFAIADGMTFLLFVVWVIGQVRSGAHTRALLAWCVLPGIAVAFVLCGWTLGNWRKGELYFGASSLGEMWTDVARASFDDINANMAHPLLERWGNKIGRVLPFAATLVTLLLLGIASIERRRSRSAGPDRSVRFIQLLAGVVAITLLLHWLAFHLINLPLPKGRTALFFVPLSTLIFGAALAIRFRTTNQVALRWLGMVTLILMALYFVGCLRLGYFRAWKFDIDTKHLYWMLTDLNRRCGIDSFGVDWRYSVPYSFYNESYHNRPLREHEEYVTADPPDDKGAYALYLPTSEAFIKSHGLHVIYHNDETGSAVAIRGCPANAGGK